MRLRTPLEDKRARRQPSFERVPDIEGQNNKLKSKPLLGMPLLGAQELSHDAGILDPRGALVDPLHTYLSQVQLGINTRPELGQKPALKSVRPQSLASTKATLRRGALSATASTGSHPGHGASRQGTPPSPWSGGLRDRLLTPLCKEGLVCQGSCEKAYPGKAPLQQTTPVGQAPGCNRDIREWLWFCRPPPTRQRRTGGAKEEKTKTQRKKPP